jgi:HEAT repeat protein
VPALIETLQDEDWDVRSSAAHALGLIGPKAMAAVPALLGTLQETDMYGRMYGVSVSALNNIDPGLFQRLKERAQEEMVGAPGSMPAQHLVSHD